MSDSHTDHLYNLNSSLQLKFDSKLGYKLYVEVLNNVLEILQVGQTTREMYMLSRLIYLA